MATPRRARRTSALNLNLEGSVGSFRIGGGPAGEGSIETLYFLTHVGLDFASPSNEALLSHIAPVREIFDFEQLEFDEIMQRDIDDARVSAELVPYLLDKNSAGLVKLFPPIIVVVLPTREGENRPADFYPEVSKFKRESTDSDPVGEGETYDVVRSGKVGAEVFEFERLLVDGEPSDHDVVGLRLNTHRTALVIVDGQHRAMALLALYRNLKDQWSDAKREPFKDYYAEWTPSYIDQFNLKKINLPIMLCTFPELDTEYGGESTLKKAARSIFLTLNKTARKVTVSRNRLLDDSDLVAHFLRLVLADVKSRDNISEQAFRIHNVELDQVEDKVALNDKVAVTGVNHIYYIIEHLLLNRPGRDVNGVRARSGARFSTRTDLDGNHLYTRLEGQDLLGEDVASNTTRLVYSSDTADLLGIAFMERYGHFIVSSFESFLPYYVHNRAVLQVEREIDEYRDRKLKPILFEGQGIGTVFERHRENLRAKIEEGYFGNEVPKLEEILASLDRTRASIDRAIADLRQARTKLYLAEVRDASKLTAKDGEYDTYVVQWLSQLYDNVFTTVAFQSALVCGFFGEVENATLLDETLELNVAEQFSEYLGQLSAFFVPTTWTAFRSLHRVLTGDLVDDGDALKPVSTNWAFRDVVYRGEMKPDQWPKYKYLFLELWQPSSEGLAESVERSRDKARRQVFAELYLFRQGEFSKEQARAVEDLTPEERSVIAKQTYDDYAKLLKELGHTVTLQAVLSRAEENDESESEESGLADE